MISAKDVGSQNVAASLKVLFATGRTGQHRDEELLSRYIRERNLDAFSEIVERHGSMVFCVANRILDDVASAEDAFQATFLILLRDARRVCKHASLASWLHGVARRVALKLRAQNLRRGALLRRREHVPSDLAEHASSTDSILYLDLHAEIDRLPLQYRAPIVLCYIEGLTHEQAAARLNWPVGTVRGRLSRARDRLRARLSRAGYAGMPLLAASVKTSRLPIKPILECAAGALSKSSLLGLAPGVARLVQGGIAHMLPMGIPIQAIYASVVVAALAGVGLLRPQAKPGLAQSTFLTTSPMEGRMQTIVYSVADLKPRERENDSHDARLEAVAQFIAANIAPGTWSNRDREGNLDPKAPQDNAKSAGSITPFLLNQSLIIRHSPEVHAQIVTLFRGVRRFVDEEKAPQQANRIDATAFAAQIEDAHLARFQGRKAPASRKFQLDSNYVVKTGDRVRVRVPGAEGLKPLYRESVISEGGTIDLGPAYGQVAVQGTINEVKAAIVLQLRRIMTDVQLGLVRVEEGEPQAVAPEAAARVRIDLRPGDQPTYYVEEGVEGPGIYKLLGPTHVYDAICEAGGLSGEPVPTLARILRNNEHGLVKEAIEVELDEVRTSIRNQDVSKLPYLGDGDRLVVFSASKKQSKSSATEQAQPLKRFYVTGEVQNAGSFSWKPNFTVLEAISQIGLSADTDADSQSLRIRLIRPREGRGAPRVFNYDNLADLRPFGVDESPMLEPGDRIHVYRTGSGNEDVSTHQKWRAAPHTANLPSPASAVESRLKQQDERLMQIESKMEEILKSLGEAK